MYNIIDYSNIDNIVKKQEILTSKYAISNDIRNKRISNVIFTDYGTVKCDFITEKVVADFFTTFETMIRERKIVNCNVDLINNEMIFYLKNSRDKYQIVLPEEEFNKIKRGIPSRNTRILLTLFDFEKELAYQDLENGKRDDIDKKLLEAAINGNIINDRARKLYINKLEQDKMQKYPFFEVASVKTIENIKYNKNIITKIWRKFNKSFLKVPILLVILFSLVFSILAFLTNSIYEFMIFSKVLCLFSTPYLLELANLTGIYLKTLVKEIMVVVSHRKLINHKIKTLKMMMVPKEDETINLFQNNDKIIFLQETINKKIKRLSILIDTLSNENRKHMADLLLEKIKKYQEKIKKNETAILKLYSDDVLKNMFIQELNEFEEELKLLLDEEKDLKDLNSSIVFLQNMKSSSKIQCTEEPRYQNDVFINYESLNNEETKKLTKKLR